MRRLRGLFRVGTSLYMSTLVVFAFISRTTHLLHDSQSTRNRDFKGSESIQGSGDGDITCYTLACCLCAAFSAGCVVFLAIALSCLPQFLSLLRFLLT